jgi:hypothetical protein
MTGLWRFRRKPEPLRPIPDGWVIEVREDGYGGWEHRALDPVRAAMTGSAIPPPPAPICDHETRAEAVRCATDHAYRTEAWRAAKRRDWEPA